MPTHEYRYDPFDAVECGARQQVRFNAIGGGAPTKLPPGAPPVEDLPDGGGPEPAQPDATPAPVDGSGGGTGSVDGAHDGTGTLGETPPPTAEQIKETEAAIDEFDLAPGDGVFSEVAGERPGFGDDRKLSEGGEPDASDRPAVFNEARDGIVDLVKDGTTELEISDFVRGHFQSAVILGGTGAEGPAQQKLIDALARIYLGT